MSHLENDFTSKSNVLKLLNSRLKKSKIEKIFDFTVQEWKNNKRHGQGTLSFPDGGIQKGLWSGNKLKRQN